MNNVVKLAKRAPIIPQGQANAQAKEAARQEAAALVKKIIERGFGELTKVSIGRAASTLGWSYGRTEDIWRVEARTIQSWEMDMLRSHHRALRYEHEGAKAGNHGVRHGSANILGRSLPD